MEDWIVITLINEENMTLENYNEFLDIPTGKLNHLVIDYKLLDNNVDIEFYTLQSEKAYNSDVM